MDVESSAQPSAPTDLSSLDRRRQELEVRRLEAEARKAELEATDLETPYWRRAVFISTALQGAALILTIAGAAFSISTVRLWVESKQAIADKTDADRQRVDAETKRDAAIMELSEAQSTLESVSGALERASRELIVTQAETRQIVTRGQIDAFRPILNSALTPFDIDLVVTQLNVSDPVVRSGRYDLAIKAARSDATAPLVRVVLFQALNKASGDPKYLDLIPGMLLEAPELVVPQLLSSLRVASIPDRVLQRTLWTRFVKARDESRVAIAHAFLEEFYNDPLYREPFIIALESYDGTGAYPHARHNMVSWLRAYARTGTINEFHFTAPTALKRLILSEATDQDRAVAAAWFVDNRELVDLLTAPKLTILEQCSDRTFTAVMSGIWVGLKDLANEEGGRAIK